MFLFAYIFGIISPKKTITRVTAIVRNRKIKVDFPKTLHVKYADKVIIATFIRLFKINIVASSFSGVFNRFIVLTNPFLCVLIRVFFWVLVKEKKATSDPEIKPDKSNNKNKKTPWRNILKTSRETTWFVKNNKSSGSGNSVSN